MRFSQPRAWFLAAVAAAAAGIPVRGSAQVVDTTSRAVRLGITYAPGTKPGLLVLPVNGEQGDSVRAILQRDFDFGDRINVILTDSIMADGTDSPRSEWNYPLYAKLGAVAMVQATVTPAGLHVAVHNVAQKKIERVKDFPLTGAPHSADWRLSLHAVADEIELWMTSVKGIAATRVLYVDRRGGGHVWQVDSDGANPVAITGAESAMSPTWNPRTNHIAYMTLGNEGSRIVIRELGGPTRVLNTPPGSNTSPVFSPDGSTIIYAHGGENGTDLYATNAFGSEPARRITAQKQGSDNTSATFSPDGRRIAFTSSRVGHPEIYISDADGTNADLLTPFNFGDQSYRAEPNWAPDGRLIAFQSQIDGKFQIMTINLRDKSIKRHTSEGINESPSWAPDSRHIVFTSDRTGKQELFVLDTESARVRQLTHASTGARLSAWSPLLRGR